MICNHLGCLLLYSNLMLHEIRYYKTRQFALIKLLTLKNNRTTYLCCWNNLLSFINASILVTKDKNRRKHRLLEIFH